MKKFRDAGEKLTIKTVIMGAIAVALIFIIIMSVYMHFITKNADKATYSYLKEISHLAERELSAKFEGNLQTLRALANFFNMSEKDTTYFMKILNAESGNTEFDNIFYVDTDGNGHGAGIENLNVSSREYFQKTINGMEGIYVLEKGSITGLEVILYAVPVYENGVASGMVCGTQEYTTYQKLLDNGFFGDVGYSNIIDSKGNIVIKAISKNNSNTIKNVIKESEFKDIKTKEKVVDDLKKGKSGIVEFKAENTEKMSAYSPLEYNGWVILSTVSSQVAKAQTFENFYLTLIICGFLVIFIVGFFLYASIQQLKNVKLIERLAFVDPLTEGLNLNMFKQLATKMLEKSKTAPLAACRIDINNFKIINDMYGFDEGDRLLKNMHKGLETVLDSEGLLARIQNDEFISLTKFNGIAEIRDLDKHFKECFVKLHNEGGHHYSVNFTVGIYIVLPNEKDIVQIIEKTSMAHRKAKKLNEVRMVFYDEDIREEAIKEKNIENEMGEALENEEFEIYYQPKVDLFTRKIVGAEALARWVKSPDHIVPPMEFIPTLEKNGFIVNLDLYVLEQTCKWQKQWIDSGLEPITISINQSKKLVCLNDYIDKIHAIVTKYGIPTSLIEIELTETIIHDDITRLNDITKKLKKMGYVISIDDFGSGYSSLNLLKDIEVDVLKIDREFLCMAEGTKRGEVVLSNIINMAKALEMSVVTEGVETENQAEMLRRLKCDTAQGFLYARPMPVAKFEERLKEGK